MAKIKRHFLHGKKYTSDETELMRAVHKYYLKAMPGQISDILKMNDDFTESVQQLAEEDTHKDAWVGQLKQGLLQTKADIMIGHLCGYTAARLKRFVGDKGNPNDPYNLVCYELLDWLTRTLSHAPCNEVTLKMVKARSAYIGNLVTLFEPGTLHKNTMRGGLVAVQAILDGSVTLTIKREIANTHASEHLEGLQELGKMILDIGFQIVYHIINNTPNTPCANMTRFRQHKEEPVYQPMAATKIGKSLLCTVTTREFKLFFNEQFEENTDLATQSNNTLSPLGQPRKMSLRALQAANNPFLDSMNQLCLPRELSTNTIIEYLGVIAGQLNNAGIYPPLQEDESLLTTYIEMLSILIELAKVFLACDEAKALAGIGGDLLVYGISNEQINRLMDTLTKLCTALNTAQMRLYATCDTKYKILTRDNLTEKDEHKHWVENFEVIPSLQTLLAKALKDCTDQASYVKEQAKMILSDEWLTKAQEQTQCFAKTAMELNHHVDFFLQRKPTPPMVERAPTWIRPAAPISGPAVELLDEDAAQTVTSPRGQLAKSLRNSFGKLKDLLIPASEADTQEASAPRGRSLSTPLRTSYGRVKSVLQKEGDGDSTAAVTAELPGISTLDGSMSARKKTLNPPALSSPEVIHTRVPTLPAIAVVENPPLGTSTLDGSMSARKKTLSPPALSSPEVIHTRVPTLPAIAVVEKPPLGTSTHDGSMSIRKKTQRPVALSSPEVIHTRVPTLPAIAVEEKPPLAISTAVSPGATKPACQKIELVGDAKSFLDDSNICWFFQQFLLKMPQATDIELRRNKISAQSATLLCELLSSHKPLEKLNLSNNKTLFGKLESFGMGGKEWNGAKAFSGLLHCHASLRVLVLIDCGLTSEGASVMSVGFAHSPSLETLDLSDNNIGDLGALSICNAALKAPKLRALMLGGNKLTGFCAEAIANLVAQNACHEKTLETLDLSVNELDNEGAIKICRAAAKHPKLCSLTLRGNKLTDQCATVFYELLKENRHIIHFDVDVADNKLSETTMIEIQRLLTLNRTPLVEESRRNNLY